MFSIATLLFGFCALAPCNLPEVDSSSLGLMVIPDLTTPGFKKVLHQVAIENPADFEGWQVVAFMALGPSHLTPVEPNVPFRYSAKYGTRVYAIPKGTELPKPNKIGRVSHDAFVGFQFAFPDVSLPSSVALFSPVESALTTVRIVSISETGIELETVRSQEFDGQGDPIGKVRILALPIGLVLFGVTALILLRRRRIKRKAA